MNNTIKMTIAAILVSISTGTFAGTCQNGLNYNDDSLAPSIAARGVGENTFRSATVSCVNEGMGYLTCSAYVTTQNGDVIEMHGLGVESEKSTGSRPW